MIEARWQPMHNRPMRSVPRRRDAYAATWLSVMDDLERELRHLGAKDIVIEAGFEPHQIRNDGWPRGSVSPSFPDVRLSFVSKHGPMTFECATFFSYEQNLRAIGLVIRDLRLMAERGVGSGTEQYRGWARLPPANGSVPAAEWANAEAAAREILTLAFPESTPGDAMVRGVARGGDALKSAFRVAAKRCHPDAGGSEAQMARLNRAMAMIEKEQA